MPSTNDILVADLLVVGTYGLYAMLSLLLLYSLFTAVKTFRRRVSWGQARVMGVPFTIFVWLQAVFYLLVLDATYGLVGLIVKTPLWLDLAISLSIIALAWWIFWRLLKRPTFKPHLFVLLVMTPLGIPGTHVVGSAVETGAIEVTQRVGIGVVKYGDALDGLVLRNFDEVAEAVPIYRALPRTTKTVAGDVTFLNSILKGRFGDYLTAKRLTGMGFVKLPSKYNGLHGIDGVYTKRNPAGSLVEILIVETKVDSGRLASKQMSDDWLLDRVSRMIASDDAAVRQTGELLRDTLQTQPSIVRKELWSHKLADGSTVVHRVDADGKPGAILRDWSDSFIKNEVINRCSRGAYECSLGTP